MQSTTNQSTRATTGSKIITAASRYGLWIAGVAFLAILAATTELTISAAQVALAAFFLFYSIHAYLLWLDKKQTKIPVWALLCGVHFVFYGLAIFTASRSSPSAFDRGTDLSDSVLTDAMLVGVVGLLAMALGRRIGGRWMSRSRIQLRLLEIGQSTPLRIHIILVMGIVVNFVGIPFFGTPLWNVSVIFFSTIPLAAFVWACLAALSRKADIDLVLAVSFLASRALSGSRVGASLGTILVPIFLAGMGVLSMKRRLPWVMIGALIFLVLFLQPSKGTIRQRMAQGEFDGSPTGAMSAWLGTAASDWGDVIAGRAPLLSQVGTTTSRTSLLSVTGLVLSMTPDTVPYQYGSGYSLLLSSWVPRFLWPDKPTANTANRFFQVAYGVTEQDSLEGVSIACGFEAEGYMNFGWMGIPVVGLLAGAVFGCYEHLFLSNRATTAATAIGLSMLWGFLTIEYQLVSYLGGILQVAVASLIVFQPRMARSYRSRAMTVPTATVSTN